MSEINYGNSLRQSNAWQKPFHHFQSELERRQLGRLSGIHDVIVIIDEGGRERPAAVNPDPPPTEPTTGADMHFSVHPGLLMNTNSQLGADEEGTHTHTQTKEQLEK